MRFVRRYAHVSADPAAKEDHTHEQSSELGANIESLQVTDSPVRIQPMSGPIDPIALGRLIERLRTERGIRSKRQAAMKCNLSDSYWGMLERGYKTLGPGGTPEPPNLDDGTALKIVWGLRLTPAEQAELFTAAGFDHLLPQPVPPDDLLKPGVLDGVLNRYTLDEISWFERTAAEKKLKRQGWRPPERASERGRDKDDEPEPGSVGDAASPDHAGPGPERGTH
jgi:hypothetical protein